MSCRHLWSDRTIVLFGDVWFSDEAANTILNDTTVSLRFYGRLHNSELTEGGSEVFGLNFTKYGWEKIAVHSEFLRYAEHSKFRTDDVFFQGGDSFFGVGATAVLRSIMYEDLPQDDWRFEALKKLEQVSTNFKYADWATGVERTYIATIDDWTDDFDTPEKYERWLQLRKEQNHGK
jgi:hypothetical protein